MAFYELCFSPTGGTQRVLALAASAWDCPKISIDLSAPRQDFSVFSFTEMDVCFVAVPSYEGLVPPLLLPRLRALRGNGARAVAVAVFGNRAYDDTLIQLRDILQEGGFRCCAAVAAVAEHSIMRTYGAGRPDADDARELTDFSLRCKEALVRETLPEVEVPGSRPYREPGSLPSLLHTTGGRSCNGCGLCARKCPVGAIPADHPDRVDKARCIACMRCVAICPRHARHSNGLFIAIGTRMLRKKCEERKKNEFFLPA